MAQVVVEEPHFNVYKPHTNKHYSTIVCCNCGGIGHVYARCNHPITSFGIICYRLVYDIDTNSVFPEYLMVQRKDSLSYVEFMRGKYDLQNVSYLLKMFSNMIEEERQKLEIEDFEKLWLELWSTTNGKNFMKEYNVSKEKFQKLKKGYLVRSAEKPEEIMMINMDYLLANSQVSLTETEWGFPKGRRNFSDEDDRKCALREFREETGINCKNIKFVKDMKPFEEIFSGSNKVRYKHVYYIAKYSNTGEPNNQKLFNPENKHQAREIKDVNWFNFKEAQSKIRDKNIERKEVLSRLNRIILKTVSNHDTA
jgi:8-oxo-dGTP pyrophosphatase MutT (NUDIX family)